MVWGSERTLVLDHTDGLGNHPCGLLSGRGDLNSGPFDYQSNAPAVLSYRPLLWDTKVNIWLVNKNFRKPFLV